MFLKLPCYNESKAIDAIQNDITNEIPSFKKQIISFALFLDTKLKSATFISVQDLNHGFLTSEAKRVNAAFAAWFLQIFVLFLTQIFCYGFILK